MRKRPKKTKKISIQQFHAPDITVQAFADADKTKSSLRQKKGTTIAFYKEVKAIAVETKYNEEPSWDEKNLDDFDVVAPGELGSDLTGDEEDSETKETSPDIPRNISKKGLNKMVKEKQSGIHYPVDVWFQLARYIQPEDVCRFALLCKGANSVVHTVQFWKQLYLRWYRSSQDIPACLKPQHIERIHGLRCRVIRALFLCYTPFIERLKTTIPFENEPYHLVGHTCILTWHKKVKNVWNFYFKLRSAENSNHTTERTASSYKNHLDRLENWYRDLNFNPDKTCCVLQATCSNYISVPMVMGFILTKVYLNLSAGFRHYRLRLVFDTSMKTEMSKTQCPSSELILDPVLNLRVFPWWDPNYTHSLEETDINRNTVEGHF